MAFGLYMSWFGAGKWPGFRNLRCAGLVKVLSLRIIWDEGV